MSSFFFISYLACEITFAESNLQFAGFTLSEINAHYYQTFTIIKSAISQRGIVKDLFQNLPQSVTTAVYGIGSHKTLCPYATIYVLLMPKSHGFFTHRPIVSPIQTDLVCCINKIEASSLSQIFFQNFLLLHFFVVRQLFHINPKKRKN